MDFLQWTEDLSVDNIVVDNQHRELFDLTNNLILECKDDKCSPLIGETLSDLLKYAKRHFKEEEKLLREIKYPKLEEHEKMHIDFIFKIAMFCKDVLNGKSSVVEEMIEYLTDWLINHTSSADLDFKNYINQVA